MTDTWTSRDLPVLIAAAEHLDQSFGAPTQPHELAKICDMSRDDVKRAALNLVPTHLTGQVEQTLDGDAHVIITGMTDEGRRAAGVWPDRSDHLASLIGALAQAEQDTESEEERTKLQRLSDALSKAPKRITEQVVAGVIAGQIGAL